jgi:hypothetical protein
LLLTRHRTPDGIRRTGQARLHAWLKKHGARSSAAVAAAAVEAAKSQHTTVPAQHLGEVIVAALAQEIITLDKELADLDVLIAEKVTGHRHARALLSMPGFGPVVAAEFLGATGGDLTVFQSADRFAGVVGLAPAPRDSGRITGNHHRQTSGHHGRNSTNTKHLRRYRDGPGDQPQAPRESDTSRPDISGGVWEGPTQLNSYQRSTTVLLPCRITRPSQCQRTALVRALHSVSRPAATSSSGP